MTTLDELRAKAREVGREAAPALEHLANDEEQARVAAASRDSLQSTDAFASRKIVTEITAAGPFYLAEDYHQQYLQKKGLDSCRVP